jgi:hypothetical protein
MKIYQSPSSNKWFLVDNDGNQDVDVPYATLKQLHESIVRLGIESLLGVSEIETSELPDYVDGLEDYEIYEIFNNIK